MKSRAGLAPVAAVRSLLLDPAVPIDEVARRTGYSRSGVFLVAKGMRHAGDAVPVRPHGGPRPARVARGEATRARLATLLDSPEGRALTQAEVGRRLGVSRSTVTKFIKARFAAADSRARAEDAAAGREDRDTAARLAEFYEVRRRERGPLT